MSINTEKEPNYKECHYFNNKGEEITREEYLRLIHQDDTGDYELHGLANLFITKEQHRENQRKWRERNEKERQILDNKSQE